MNYKNYIPVMDGGAHPCAYGVYPRSINRYGNAIVFMANDGGRTIVVAAGEGTPLEGERFLTGGVWCVRTEANHQSAVALRAMFPFCAPRAVLKEKRTFGVGDRLGLATPGHIRVFKEYDALPVFAQQSMRELNLTGRSYDDVLDSATHAVYREGFSRGFGADGDHLKKPDEIIYALNAGYTMITLDLSEHIRNDVTSMTDDEAMAACTQGTELFDYYRGRTFDGGDGAELCFDDPELARTILIYGAAIDYAWEIYNSLIAPKGGLVDFEISIDETSTPTTPKQHFFVANELTRRGVSFATLAPRFCGEFQKGIDYIGDISRFEAELNVHAAIARRFGYKLSLHSGSDKFSVFAAFGRITEGSFHVKTAGTNWLEAMRVVALSSPSLYREVHKYALSAFFEAKKYYHVTTDIDNIPDVDSLGDHELPTLFSHNDARQLIHITYGLILNQKDEEGKPLFRDRLYSLWQKNAELYSDALYSHIGNHLKTLYSELK